MKFEQLDGVKLPMSRLIYGTGNDVMRGKDVEAAIDCMDVAFENGFNAFDTAYTYELSENNIGHWMQRRGTREKVILIDKGCNPGQAGFNEEMTPELIIRQCNESLERLQTTYSDCYNLHRDDESKPVGPIVEALNFLKSEGKIRKFGGSNWKWTRIKEANEYAAAHGLEGFTISSPCYSYAVLNKDPWGGSITISGKQNADARAWLAENRIPVFAYSSLARGYLSGKYRTDGDKPIEECIWWGTVQEYHCPENVARLAKAERLAAERGCLVSQICLAWLLQQENLVFPIVGPASLRHIESNVKALEIRLTDEDLAYLNG